MRLNPEIKEAIVGMLKQLPNISAVAGVLKVDPTSVSKERKDDPQFLADTNEALEIGFDGLEEEARRRAVEGVAEPVYYKGEVVGSIQKYSDTLLQTLLRGYRPQKFAPNTVLDINPGGSVTMTFNLGGGKVVKAGEETP